MTSNLERYVLVDGDDAFVYFRSSDIANSYTARDGLKVFGVFGPDSDEVEAERAAKEGWWIFRAVAAAPSAIFATVPRERPLLHYELSRTHSHLARGRKPAYAHTLSTERYSRLAYESSDTYDPIVGNIYVAVYGEQFVETVEVEGEWRRLDGAPFDPEPGMHWKGEMPSALRERPEYGHLFPGALSGFYGYMVRWLEREFATDPAIRIEYYEWTGGHVSVTAKSARSKRDLASFKTDRGWQPPRSFDADSFSAARVQWFAELGRIAAEIRREAMPCPCCDGSGRWKDTAAAKVAEVQSPAPDPKPARPADDDIPF